MDFDIAIRVLLWEDGDSDLVPLASDGCNTPLLTTSPGPVLALAALSAEAKQSNTAASHARLIWQRTEIRDHDCSLSCSDTRQGFGFWSLAVSTCCPMILPWGTQKTI